MNVFFIGTPLQLLNATEAKHALQLSNNHLIVALDFTFWPPTDIFTRLIQENEWESVRYLTLRDVRKEFYSPYLGVRISKRISNYRQQYRQYRNRALIDKFARSITTVSNLVLGSYHGDHSRHLANRLNYEALYLVDDGTDVLLINDERKGKCETERRWQNGNRQMSPWRGIKARVRRTILEWDQRQAAKLTFFSAYDLETRSEDRLIKNDYVHFRKSIRAGNGDGSCFFLGQCLARDGFLSDDAYLKYLQKVRSHFGRNPIIYVPHPRESEEAVNRINQQLGFIIKRLSVPIEWHLLRNGANPSILASFFCSALVSCAKIYGRRFDFKAFYLEPEDVLRWPDFVEGTYTYLRNLSDPNIDVVRF